MHRLIYKHVAAIVVVLLGALPVQANDTAETMLNSLPTALEGWSLQSGSKEMDANGVKAFGMYTSLAQDRLFVIEVDAGGQIVETMSAAWDAQMLTATIVEVGSIPYQVGPDGLTALIEGKILIRAYAPDAKEPEAIETHLQALDISALEALASKLQ